MNIAVYCGATPGNCKSFSRGAALLGTEIARQGHTLVYGGSQCGLMGVVANAALAAGGRVTGVLPNIPLIQAGRHPGLTEYLDTETLADRRTAMLHRANACIALPGGLGTLDEITEILALSRLGVNPKPCVFYNIDGFYQPLQ